MRESGLKKGIKRALGYRPGPRAAAVGAVLLLAAALVPLLRLAVYAIPWYDDYSYGVYVKRFLAEDFGIRGLFKGVVYTIRMSWYAWQGTFSSIFFMSLMPAVWGEQYYFLGPAALILLMSISVFVFVRTLVRTVLGSGRAQAAALAALVSCMTVVLVYTAQSAFYWYNAGVHYIGMHSFFLLLAAGWIRLTAEENRAARVGLLLWSVAGAVLAGGANFVTALQSLVLGISVLFLGALLRKKRFLSLLPSLLVLFVAFGMNVSAPGNNVRKAALGGMGMGAAEAILRSFFEAVRYIGIFSGWITPVVLILLIPVILMVLKGTSFRFRYPGLVLLWSFCLYATGFTPSLYSLGHAGLSRTLNAVKLTYQLLLVVNEVYLVGWLRRRSEKKGEVQACSDYSSGRFGWWFYVLMGVLMLLVFTRTSNQAGSYSSYGAWYYVHSGEANNLHEEYERRIETIESSGPDVTVEPYRYRPWFLCSGDLSENADSEENRYMAEWYGKNSISCVEKDSE